MLRNRIYYLLKPFIPRRVGMRIRRWRARHIREKSSRFWPVFPGSGESPEGWRGWPGGYRFAFVITHDVEGPEGVEKCLRLAEIEEEASFRSSFNFIPEGSYRVSPRLREALTLKGFEVGIHDLRHNGFLYRSREHFRRNAARINTYLREWNAQGFRSGFMLHNLDWLHDLDVLYDASTFDTDPFEPQPDGFRTIFPFFVKAPAGSERPGYVELPYTLPQDSTLFLLLREKTTEIWKRKLDWVAEHGGLALVNIHPDYMCFPDEKNIPYHYPVELVKELLRYVSEKYHGAYWNPLARDLASWYREELTLAPRTPAASQESSAS